MMADVTVKTHAERVLERLKHTKTELVKRHGPGVDLRPVMEGFDRDDRAIGVVQLPPSKPESWIFYAVTVLDPWVAVLGVENFVELIEGPHAPQRFSPADLPAAFADDDPAVVEGIVAVAVARDGSAAVRQCVYTYSDTGAVAISDIHLVNEGNSTTIDLIRASLTVPNLTVEDAYDSIKTLNASDGHVWLSNRRGVALGFMNPGTN